MMERGSGRSKGLSLVIRTTVMFKMKKKEDKKKIKREDNIRTCVVSK